MPCQKFGLNLSNRIKNKSDNGEDLHLLWSLFYWTKFVILKFSAHKENRIGGILMSFVKDGSLFEEIPFMVIITQSLQNWNQR